MQLRIDPEVIAGLKSHFLERRSALETGLRAVRAGGGRAFALALSELCDAVVVALVEEAARRVEADGQAATLGARRTVARELAVVALGGYGRRELGPKSDLDLMFLAPRRVDGGPEQAFIDLVLYGLWDLGLEVGHATRTVDECVKLARQDVSALTALLEARAIDTPSRTPAARSRPQELERALDRELLSEKGAELFITRKLEESERRRQRYGDTLYLLEPDVKHGEGGLRELHTALWIARARWRAHDAGELSAQGVLSPRETRAVERAHDFLLRVRAELHLAAGRRRDSLGFELQEQIARTLGYTAEDAADKAKIRHGTERFMRAYYFHAKQNQRIARLIVERATSHPPANPGRTTAAPGGFETLDGRLTVADREQLCRDPAALVRLFRVAQEEALEIYSYTKDLISGSLLALDRTVRRDPQVVADFLAILEDPKSDGSTLLAMHELGVLRRLIPELGRVSARWQHSLYHVYTVDVHSLFVVRELKRLRLGLYAQEQPGMARLIAELPRPNVLYLGGLLHDIGKGWKGGDHSLRGAEVARTVGSRLEEAGLTAWTREDTDDLVWLVEDHLALSDASQRRDLSDPELIRSFAARCKSEERLAMLYLLTFADMKATSPKVWNEWKGMLLTELYDKTRAVLRDPAAGAPRDLELHVEARRQRMVQDVLQAFASKNQAPPAVELIERFSRAVPERYLLAVPPKRMRKHVEPWREVSARGGVSVQVRHLRREDMTELTVVCPDRPGLLALLAGTLAANRLQILSAQIFSIDLLGSEPSGGKAALDILWLRDAGGGICDDPARWTRVSDDLQRIVDGGDIEQLLEQRVRGSKLPRRPRPHVETKVVVARDASQHENVIDVFCQDHLGALYTIARALADQGLSIRLAKISTQGDRVADGFYVTDLRGQKITSEDALEEIAERVKQAIDAQVG